MRIFFTYLRDLGKETLFLAIFFLGIGSSSATYLQPLQNFIILKWVGWSCIVISFIGANFRLYKKNVGQMFYRLKNLINELEANYEMLLDMKYSTAPALSDEAWKAAVFEKIPEISDILRTQINSIYIKIRGAKEIHQSIRNLPLKKDGSPLNTFPELTDMYKKLEDAKQAMPYVIKNLKDIAKT